MGWCRGGREIAVGSLVIACWAVTSEARAGNDDGVLLGNTAAMTAGAVVATVGDGSAVWYNPAGIAAADRNAVDVSGSAFQLRIIDQPQLIRFTTGESADGNAVDLISIPSAVTGVRRLDDGVNLAFGIFVPELRQRSLSAHLEHLDGGVGSRLDLGIQERSQRYHAGGALGVRIDRNFRVGFNVFVRYQTRSYDEQLGAYYEGMDLLVQQQAQIRESLTAIGIEGGAGFQWTPIPELAVGVSVRSPAMEFAWNYAASNVASEVVLDDVDPTLDSAAYDALVGDEWAFGAEASSPLRVWLGVALTLDRFWLSAEVDLQHPLDNPTVGVERDFVWNARVGAHYEVDESVRVGAGLFTDNRTRTRIRYLGEENMDYYGGTLGLELRTPHRLGEGEDADSLIFSSTFALRYAVGVGEVVGLSLDPTVGELASPDPLLASTVHEISLHIGSALFF